MKKLFILVLAVLALSFCGKHFNPVHAQVVKTITAVNYAGTAKTTVTNTDTAFFNLSVQGTSVSYQATATKVSGTVAGDIILQGSDDNSNWDAITSYTLVDQATNYKVFSPHNSAGKLQYAYYRLRVRTSGTCSITISGVEVRRSN